MTDSNQDLVIMKLDHAKEALAEAKTIQQTKKVIDIAWAAEIYAKRQRLSEDAIAYAQSIKLEALRLLGHMLKEMPKATGGDAQRTRFHKGTESPPTLADLGINKKFSMMAQQLAVLPLELFRQVEAGTVTITKALRDAQRAKGGNTNKPAWSLESVEQRLRTAINGEIVGSPPESHRLIADLLRRLADELEEADNPEVYDAVSIARDEIEIRDAEPGGFRVFDGATVVASCKSTYPDWYKVISKAKEGVTPLRRAQVEARLTDIEMGKLPTKRTEQTHFAVKLAIKDLPRTSPLTRR